MFAFSFFPLIGIVLFTLFPPIVGLILGIRWLNRGPLVKDIAITVIAINAVAVLGWIGCAIFIWMLEVGLSNMV